MARRFRFRLEAVQRVRTLREREARRRVGQKLQEIATIDQFDARARVMIADQEQELRQLQSRPVIDAQEVARGRAWIIHLRQAMAQRQLQRMKLQEELHRAQQELASARVQTRIIEKLRERRLAEYRDAEGRREQRQMDEVAQQLHIRAMSEAGPAARER